MDDRKKKILVVDDDDIIRNSISDDLKFQEYLVNEAKDGEEGLRLALVEKPDLILLDIMMPKMNGLEVIQKLREDAWGKRVPVIIISSLNTSDEILNEIIKNSPTYYIMKKDWDLKDLANKIKNALEFKSGDN